MDTNMEDAQLAPPSMPASEPATIPTLDGWIESLMSCKQLAEADVQRLCEKVSHHRQHPASPASDHVRAANLIDFNARREKFCKKSPTYSQ